MRFIDDRSLNRLEFKSLLNRVQTLSSYGNEKLKNLKNYNKGEEEKLEEEFSKMELLLRFSEGNRDLLRNIEGIIHKLKNIKNILNNCLKGNILDDVDLFELKIQGMLMENLNEYLKELPDKLKIFRLNDIGELVKILDPDGEKIPTFYIYDSYSKKLEEIRKKKKEIEKKIFSSSEFDEISRLKEKRLGVLVEEEEEELNIRKEISMKILKYVEIYLDNIDKIGSLDFLMAKVKFAQQYNGKRAKICKEMKIVAKGLVNIEVKEILDSKGRIFTPIDIELNSGVTVITGANMGGKSIALKTITENLLLFNYGFFVVADEAEFPIVDFVFFVSDDMQDISKGLSTFGAEIMKLKEVSTFLDLGTGLVVFDEFARGTNPKEGQKFVKALAEYLNEKNSISLVTTHFDGIAQKNMNHYEVVGLKNIDFNKLKRRIEISDNSMSIIQNYMDYRLEKSKDGEVPKDALNIAKLIGINKRFADIILQEYGKED